jgi:hypothetical protein
MTNYEIQMRPFRRPGRYALGTAILLALLCGAGAISILSAVAATVVVNDSTGIWGTASGGAGTAAQSTTHQVAGTLGQWATGQGESSDRKLAIGFWSGGACDCRYHGDINTDGVVNILDVVEIVSTAFRGGPNPPSDALCPHFNRGDVNCDGKIDIIDVVVEVSTAFRGDDRRCNPCAH